MEPVFVKAVFDLDCDWEGLPPSYRIYVNDELFTERTWIWTDHYLSERLDIKAVPGVYTVKLDPVGPNLSRFQLSNQRVAYGPARWIDHNTLEILHEST